MSGNRVTSWVGDFLQDLRYGARMLRKNPSITLLTLLTLAIGIGANAAVFSVADALLLRPLPYPAADRVVALWLRSPGIGILQDWPSTAQYHDIKTQNHVFEETALALGRTGTLTGITRAEKVDVFETSSSMFRILGAQPLLGQTISPEEDVPGKPATAVLSYGIWQQAYGGDPQIIGRSITLNGKPYAVVGVLSPKFALNHEVMPGVGNTDKADIFLPLPMGAEDENNYDHEDYNVLARLKPGVTAREAQADIDIVASRIREKLHRDPTFTISVVPLIDQVVGNVRRTVIVLFGSVALVLLIGCANVANLLLARATGRAKEIAVRRALGAGRARLVRQFLTESILLGTIGGAAGLMLAWWSLRAVQAINPGNIPRMDDVRIDGEVFAFTFAISILTGIVFGMAPAFRVSNLDLNSALKAGGRTSETGGGLSARRDKLRGLLVISEIALSLTLLAGAGLLVRSFVRLIRVPPGFDVTNVMSMRVMLKGPKYAGPKASAQFYQELGRRIGSLPGVTSEGAVSVLPLTTFMAWGPVDIEGYVRPPSEPDLQVDERSATPDYFRTMQIPLVRGRFFSASDTVESQLVVVIDEKMERRFWPRGDSIGKHIRPVDDPKTPWYTIVGVAGTVKQYGLDADTHLVAYYPHTQDPSHEMYVVARSGAAMPTLSTEMIREVHAIDPDVPVYEISGMPGRLDRSLARQRFAMTMLGAFAGFALLLAAVGVYGVMSYLVTQSAQDIAIRMALGAQRGDILRLVFQHGIGLAAIGIAAGVAGALSLSRVMGSLLYGVSASDGVTLASVGAMLAIVTMAACFIPALRATRVDPISALRCE